MPACSPKCPVVRAQLRKIVTESPGLFERIRDRRGQTDPEVVDQSLLVGSDPQTTDDYGRIKAPFVPLRKDDYDLYGDVDDPKLRDDDSARYGIRKDDETIEAARLGVGRVEIEKSSAETGDRQISRSPSATRSRSEASAQEYRPQWRAAPQAGEIVSRIPSEASAETGDRQISGSPSATRSRSEASAQEYRPQWRTAPQAEEIMSRAQSSQRSDQVSFKMKEEDDVIGSKMSSKPSSVKAEADETDVTYEGGFVEEAVGTGDQSGVPAYESGDTRVDGETEMGEVSSDRKTASKGSRTPSGLTEQELYQEDMDADISASKGGSAGDMSECEPNCPRRISNRRRLRKLEERQKCVDMYYLTKGSNYFEDVCTCSLACIVRALRDDPFVQSILTSTVVFTVGLKLCSELNAWYLPFRIT